MDDSVRAFEKRGSGTLRIPVMSFAKRTWQKRPVLSERAFDTSQWISLTYSRNSVTCHAMCIRSYVHVYVCARVCTCACMSV